MQYNVTFRQKDKGWQVIVSYKHAGKWKQRSKQGFSSKRDAKQAADVIIEGLKGEDSLSDAPEFQNMALGAFLSVFYEDMKGKIRASTLNLYKVALRAFSPLYGELLRDITPPMISACLRERKISVSTQKLYLAKLSKVYVHAQRFYNIVKANPCKNVIIKNEPSGKIRVLEPGELDDLLARSCDYGAKVHLGILISAYTGLRLGEVAGLRWEDFDLQNGFIRVKRQMLAQDHGDGLICPPKTASSVRTVPIPSRLRDAVRAFQPSTGQIFTLSDRRKMASAVSEVSHVTFHALRHTFATTLISHGVDVKTVAALLGDRMETVMKTYIHYTDDMRKSAARDIEKIFG